MQKPRFCTKHQQHTTLSSIVTWHHPGYADIAFFAYVVSSLGAQRFNAAEDSSLPFLGRHFADCKAFEADFGNHAIPGTYCFSRSCDFEDELHAHNRSIPGGKLVDRCR
jgi:hypothetical protein